MTEQTPSPSNMHDADPRLLLPDWLRDDPPRAQGTERASPLADSASNTVHEINNTESISTSAAKAVWQQPPPRVDSYDPSHLIGAGDLPSWIRELASQDPPLSVSVESNPSTAAVDDVEIVRSEEDVERPAVNAPSTLAGPAWGDAGPSTDLTETGFVLIAGAALVAIVAALALFYL